MPDAALAWLKEGTSAREVLLFAAGYVIATALTMAVFVAVLATLPVTYFRDGPDGPAPGRQAHHALIRLARNGLGMALIGLGFFLSLPLVPGQGVLTMLIGLILVDFPGKRRLEQRLVARPRVLETMNRIRGWAGRPPLVR
jgi:hypothetical protein